MKYLFVIVTLLVLLTGAVNAATSCPDGNYTVYNGVCIPANTGLPDPEGGIKTVVSNILTWLLGIFGFLAIIAFIISGIFYLTAAGDAEQEKKAKKAMLMSIVGVLVGLSGFVVVQAINTMLGAAGKF